jgi:hypothetical protein
MPNSAVASRPDASGVTDLPTVTRELMQLNLTHYSNLLNTYADFTNQIFATVFQTAPGSSPLPSAPERPEATHPGSRVELVFTGQPTELISRSFVVANKKGQSAEVVFELTEFVSDDGASRFRAPVTFAPDKFVLSPGAEQVVECRIPLISAFVAGARYTALVRVKGFPGMETALIVVPKQPGRQSRAERGDAVRDSPSTRPKAAKQEGRRGAANAAALRVKKDSNKKRTIGLKRSTRA